MRTILSDAAPRLRKSDHSETCSLARAAVLRDGRFARRANESFRRAVEAQRAGDWARYGEELRRLEDVLRQLQAAVGERKP